MAGHNRPPQGDRHHPRDGSTGGTCSGHARARRRRIHVADDHRDLTAAVAALPTKQRQAVAYHYLAGLPYAEIAALIDSSAAAARRAAADGIATLRRTYAHDITSEFADDHH